ncbi:T9SS type B sorting domain-containing protein [Neolewinella aurantiaca]|uniref:T9SS type B sorting domain-containing protein n=1 Tax=Neolewinella aurantiaca TaxID=2602767 RepID=A0A5C7G0H0_9BACT|nr:gliding motility-associated C-terminal domain-containing protein [Neolewinella aurantiaca]TXF91175.1 T9SS type B sorting domain-containing protein [Neolewinella aurantiaca]
MNFCATKVCFALSLLLYLAGTAAGQNIIADPGFEGWTGSNNGGNTLDGMTDWYNANGTADLHHTSRNPGTNLSGLNPCPLGNGRTDCGFPVAGSGVMGAYKANGADGSKEWAGAQLTEPMVPGDCYEISFWVQNKRDDPARELVTNQWGVFFSETMQPQFNPNLFNFDIVANQWVASDQVIDGSEWTLVELNFEADQAYEYLFLGFMGNVSDATQRLYNDDPQLGCYVWFDELYVRHVDVEVPETLNICAGETTTIDFVSDYSINWTDGEISDTTRSFEVTPLVSTTYYVTATGNTGCTKTDSVTVEVNFPVSSIYPQELCNYSAPVAVDEGIGPGRWVGPGITDEVAGIFDPVVAGSGVHTVYFLAEGGCAESGSYEIIVREVAPPQIRVDLVEGCTPLTVNITEELTTEPGVGFRWTFGDTTIISTTAETAYTFHEGGEYEVSATLVYSPVCEVTATLPAAIRVNQSPVADFLTTPTRLTNLEGSAVFSDRSEGMITEWYWDVAGLTSSDGPEARYDFTSAGEYDVFLEVTDAAGCSDSIRQAVTVLPDAKVYLPTAFSPNFDGINDQFQPGIAGRVTDYELSIFNRWGGVVFTSSDQNILWDGRGNDGEPADVGTYLFVLTYRAEDGAGTTTTTPVSVSGSITLLR